MPNAWLHRRIRNIGNIGLHMEKNINVHCGRGPQRQMQSAYRTPHKDWYIAGISVKKSQGIYSKDAKHAANMAA